MGATKEQVLERLTQAGVAFDVFEHAPVATCEAQVEALKGVAGAPAGAVVTKNLFLRDKKRRQYLVTAPPDARVDLKVLSARLGCGKGGLSWASEELMARSLQVQPGCVTPLALANGDSTRHVVLLVDARLRAPGVRFYVHPIVNSASVLLDAAGLDAFLGAVGRAAPTWAYVDLEADPKIDRDNPPDLKGLADSVEPPPKEEEEGGNGGGGGATSGASSSSTAAALGSGKAAAAAAAAAAAGGAAASGAAAAAAAPGKAAKKAAAAAAGGKAAASKAPLSAAERYVTITDVAARTNELVDHVARALTGGDAAAAVAAAAAAAGSGGVGGGAAYALERLRADVQMQLTALKNAAYAAGYAAGTGAVVAYARREWA